MKNKITAVFCFLLLSISVRAQHLDIGLHAMANVVTIINPNNYTYSNGMPVPDYSYKNKWGMEYGLSAGYDFISMLGVHAEINVSSQGLNTTHSDAATNVNREIDLKYVQVPILLKFNTGGTIARYYLEVGPQFGFLSTGQYKVTTNGKDSASDMVANGRYSKSDLSFVLGTGVEIGFLEKFYVNVGVRLNYGFSDINASAFKKSNGDVSNNAWGGFEVGVHYKL